MKFFPVIIITLFAFAAKAQIAGYTPNSGHSHNDYNQKRPFYTAYNSGMGSVEADVFIKNGKILVAHNEEDTNPARDLETLYLKPIAKAFRQHKGHIFADTSLKMQLLIDIKLNHKEVLAHMIILLKPYLNYFDQQKNPNAVKIIISGDVPAPANFKDYPSYIYFDGRTTNSYTAGQLQRLGMVSENIASFTKLNSIGLPALVDHERLKSVVDLAHSWNKPFRFWGTADRPDSWKLLQDIGADWIGTDHPEELSTYLQ
ncbi:MAG: hypothetical protein V4687_03680 [Bacteroidota bacterium]